MQVCYLSYPLFSSEFDVIFVLFLNAAGPSPVPVSVDEQTDVESLAGHHLCITERGSNRKPLQKAASFVSYP